MDWTDPIVQKNSKEEGFLKSGKLNRTSKEKKGKDLVG